jgi:hypothetical protein
MIARTARDKELILADVAAGTRAATTWLLEHVPWLVDDSPGDDAGADAVAGAYRVPYALALSGRRPEAARALTWMERHVLDGSGDLCAGPMRAVFSQRWSCYPLAIIAQAAWHLERYDTAEAIHQTLFNFRDAQTGGAYAQRPELRTHRRQDLFTTAQLGLTGLTLGDRVLADGAYGWLATLHNLQPELPDRLYTACDGGRLICRADEVDEDRFGLVTEFNAPRQAFYNPGIAAAFLARYSAQRGEPAARLLAESYLSLTEGGGAQQFDSAESVQVCKFGWGAAALLDLGSEPRLLEHALRMAQWFLDCQHPDGHWQNSAFLLPGGPTLASNIEVTAEFIQHLVTISSALAGCRAEAVQ